MKIQKRSKKLQISLGLGLVLLATIAIVYFLYLNENSPLKTSTTTNTGISYDAATDEQTEAGNTTKSETIKGDDEKFNNDDDSDQTNSPSITDLQSSITLNEVNGSTLYIRNEIRGVYASGSCTLTLKKADITVVKKSGVQPLAKISTCRGFNIPTSELSPGTWNINLTVIINGQKGSSQASVNV